MMHKRKPSQSPGSGFTLVEVLVALTILSVIAVMTWRGIAIMAQAQDSTQAYTDDVLALQAGLAQWQADLDAMVTWPRTAGAPDTAARSLSWDGRVLRVTRGVTGDTGAGVRVVAWSRSSDGAWRRWQSAPMRTQSQWRTAWQAAARWAESGAPETAQNVGDVAVTAVTIAQLRGWQLHYFQGNAWSNPLSSSGDGDGNTGSGDDVLESTLPDAVRLLITLAPGQAIAGPLSLDWVRPDFGGSG